MLIAHRSPCIIFIDEIDAIGGSRNLKDQSAMKMTLNELLVQMDGFAANNGIIVIGATNFKKSLDQALIRPGRFDKMVPVSLPDVQGRKQILELYSSQTKMDKDVDISVLARGTPGMSGAELYNLVNQAAVKSSIEGLDAISHKALEWAKDKILMGAERKVRRRRRVGHSKIKAASSRRRHCRPPISHDNSNPFVSARLHALVRRHSPH